MKYQITHKSWAKYFAKTEFQIRPYADSIDLMIKVRRSWREHIKRQK